jgi:hypothetical protein
MSDSASLIQTIVSGVVSGGASAGTAFAAVFRDIKKRLKSLEDKVGDDGADGDPKTGLHLDEIARKVKKEVDSWEEDPPEWLLRLINRAARSSSVNLENHAELERIIEQRFRTNAGNIQRLEERLELLQKTLDTYVSQVEYEKDARERSEELSSIREQLATANGLLRGIMTAMGYIDPTKKRPGV